ncbi:alkaline phosphatase family protein [Candidatus Poribacteria bacterium]|nr:alkaline phosphatase family protein [Candidatus Poribacteria bacterium]
MHTTHSKGKAERIMIVVWDGMRPDLVSPANTPHLWGFAQRGVTFSDNHSCFPTLTRLNSASISTGAYPRTHGLMGNTVLVPELNPTRGISTGDYENLIRFDQVTDGHLLTTDTLAQMVVKAGGTTAVASSCSTGAAFLLNHKLDGWIVNHSYILPDPLSRTIKAQFGTAPEPAYPNTGRNVYAIRVLTEYILREIKPTLLYVWLSDPDHTQHAYGPGAPTSMEAIQRVDAHLGDILSALDKFDLRDSTDLFVLSDHGFVTQEQPVNLSEFLIDAGLKRAKESTDVICVDTHIYVQDHDIEKIRGIVEFLQEQEWCGPIFTRHHKDHDANLGQIEGTLSMKLIGNDHPRGGDILYSYAWNAKANRWGVRGTTAGGSGAGHGCISPFELKTMLFAAGPDFKSGVISQVPSGNIDVAMTALDLLGIQPSGKHDGRVLREGLLDGPEPQEIYFRKEHIRAQKRSNGFCLETLVQISTVGETWYLDKGSTLTMSN